MTTLILPQEHFSVVKIRMPCEVTVWQSHNREGKARKFTSSVPNLDTTEIKRNTITSYEVNADNGCLITAWRHPNYGYEGRYLKGYQNSLNWRRKWNDNNWNDDIDSIKIQKVGPQGNDLGKYLWHDMSVPYYTPYLPQDNYCEGCRWWPHVKTPEDSANANRDDVMLREGVTFRPCPGGTGYFNSGSGVRCIYSKTDDAQLRQLNSNKNGVPNDPRATMWTKLSDQFCKIPGNIEKNPGGSTCLERDTSNKLAKDYCGVGDRMRTEAGICKKENLGETFYNELAEKYCKTITGQANDWCSCYNVINNVCDKKQSAAGCAEKAIHYDTLVEATPAEFRSAWAGRAGCVGQVCQGNKYIVQNANQGCDAPIQICKQDISASNLSESSIAATCELNANKGGGDGGDGENNKGTGGILEDKKLIGAGLGVGTIFSSSSSILIIIIVFLLMRRGSPQSK